MDGKEIGKMLGDAYDGYPTGSCIAAGGNVGMAFIAVAVSELAAALTRYSEAIEAKAAMENGYTKIGDVTVPPEPTTGGPETR